MPKQQAQQSYNPGFGWGKAVGMLFAVIIPAALVAYANYKVFPDSYWLATGMVIVSVGIAGLFSVASGYATSKCRRYCLFAHLVLCIMLSANLAAHWVLSRQASGARQATQARHVEEDRAESRRRAQVDDALRITQANKEFAQADARRLNAEAWRNNTARQLGMSAPRGARLSSSAPIAPMSTLLPNESPTQPGDSTPKLTVEQVMERWSDRLLWFAIADLLTSVVAFGICALMWEWDRNRNGIPDHLEHLWLTQQYVAQPSQPIQVVQSHRPSTSAAPPPFAARRPVTSHNGAPRP